MTWHMKESNKLALKGIITQTKDINIILEELCDYIDNEIDNEIDQVYRFI